MMNAAGLNEESTGLIHCFAEGLLNLFDISSFASFCEEFVAGISTACPIRFLVVDVGSPRPINRVLFGVDGDEDGQIIAGLEAETDQFDSSAMSLEVKLMSGEFDRLFFGSRVASFSL